jgi:hypothetical protein
MKRNRGWIWFFAVLAVLAAAAIGINWWYNARQQLTPEQLQAAMALWAAKGPADYDLVIDKTYSSAYSDGTESRDRIEAVVRNKQVVAAALNGAPMERRQWPDNDVPGWFGFVERFLQIDTQPGARRTFRVAEFHPDTGQLLRFRRRVSRTRERQEVVLRLTPVTREAPGP